MMQCPACHKPRRTWSWMISHDQSSHCHKNSCICSVNTSLWLRHVTTGIWLGLQHLDSWMQLRGTLHGYMQALYCLVSLVSRHPMTELRLNASGFLSHSSGFVCILHLRQSLLHPNSNPTAPQLDPNGVWHPAEPQLGPKCTPAAL